MARPKVKISERAILARINRRLRKDLRGLKKCRVNSSGYTELGDYYVVDYNRNYVVEKHVDLDAYGRELGILADWEVVASEE